MHSPAHWFWVLIATIVFGCSSGSEHASTDGGASSGGGESGQNGGAAGESGGGAGESGAAGRSGGGTADSAVANNVVYANGTNWPGDGPSNGVPPVGGDVVAISGDGSTEIWRFPTPGSPDLGAVAVANGVVYFASGFAGALYALDAATGTQLAAVQIGLAVSGPSVAGGQVYVGGGLDFGSVSAPGSIIALGL